MVDIHSIEEWQDFFFDWQFIPSLAVTYTVPFCYRLAASHNLLLSHTMEATTLLLLAAAIIAAFLFLSSRDPKRLRLKMLAKNLPGPPAYPIVGTSLPFMLVPRHSEYSVMYITILSTQWINIMNIRRI